jgi:hypothetical protein
MLQEPDEAKYQLLQKTLGIDPYSIVVDSSLPLKEVLKSSPPEKTLILYDPVTGNYH